MHLEQNERQINSTSLLRIDDYSKYNFSDNPGYITYTICRYEEVLGFDEKDGSPILRPDGTQAYTIFKWPEQTGTLDLTFDIVNQWGADDQIIFDYTIEQLGL